MMRHWDDVKKKKEEMKILRGWDSEIERCLANVISTRRRKEWGQPEA